MNIMGNEVYVCLIVSYVTRDRSKIFMSGKRQILSELILLRNLDKSLGILCIDDDAKIGQFLSNPT